METRRKMGPFTFVRERDGRMEGRERGRSMIQFKDGLKVVYKTTVRRFCLI